MALAVVWLSCSRRKKFMTRSNGPIKVLAVDDHPLVREGIGAVIASEPDIALVAEAANGREAIECFRTHHPEVTLMDLQMPQMSGFDAMIKIREEFPSARIIVLTTYHGDIQALRAIRAGAAGYLLKSMVRRELVDTIRSVHAGKRYIPAEIAAELAEHVSDDALSPREIEVLRLVAQGNSNKQIAAQLAIVEETVKTHMTNILSKLGANDRTHAVTIAITRGFFGI
jgi:DNA-binding NarL/FixJ family response regulator